MPQCDHYQKLKDLIEDNGGLVCDVYEAYSFQIKPDKYCKEPSFFYTGKVYSDKWIYDSIQKGEFIWPNNKYLLGFNKNLKKKSLPKSRCNYTITEILQIMDFAERQKKDFPD